MENVTQSLAQDPQFSQLENKSSGAQPRRLYETTLRGVNSASVGKESAKVTSQTTTTNQPSTSHSPVPWQWERERSLLEVSWRPLQSRYRAAFYHFMQSADIFKTGFVLSRMSKILLIILSETHFEYSVCLQKRRYHSWCSGAGSYR